MAWVTVEATYVPHTDVFPSFETTGIDPSFVLQPFNYLEKEPGGAVDNLKENSEGSPLPDLRQRSKREKEFVCRPVLAKSSSDALANFSCKQLLLLCGVCFSVVADFRLLD